MRIVSECDFALLRIVVLFSLFISVVIAANGIAVQDVVEKDGVNSYVLRIVDTNVRNVADLRI